MVLGLLTILLGVAIFAFLIMTKSITLESWLDLPWYQRGDFFFLAPLLRRFVPPKKKADPKD